MQDVNIGPLPPPLGGISVYLYRLSKLEKKSIFLDQKEFQKFFKSSFWFIKQIFNFNKKNYVCHSHSLYIRLMLYFLSFLSIHEFSLIIHGRSLIEQYNKSNFFMKFLIGKMLKRAEFIQVVNNDFRVFINSLGIKTKRIFVKNAFLPPPIEEESKILNTYDGSLINFLQIKKPLITANAYALVFHSEQDLYGLDMCIELTKLLKKDYPNIGFLFALADEKRNPIYLEKMKNKVKELKLQENFYFMIGQKELWPIFRKIDLMVRPTNTDGDSISIREALHFNTLVVASNITTRPEGCILFQNRDLNDFYNKCKLSLKKIQLS